MSDAGLVLIFCFLDRLLLSIMKTEHITSQEQLRSHKSVLREPGAGGYSGYFCSANIVLG